MLPTLLVLTAALTSPSQVQQPERVPKFPPPYEELDLLCVEANDVRWRLLAEANRVEKVRRELWQRDVEGTFEERLTLLRDFVRLSDGAYRQAMLRKERFERAYQRNPLKQARDCFEEIQKEICRYRTTSRMLVYCEICTHRWSWERGKEEGPINGRIMMWLATTWGMKGEVEKFLLGVAEIEVWVTEQYQSVAGGLELLLKPPSGPPAVPRPSQP